MFLKYEESFLFSLLNQNTLRMNTLCFTITLYAIILYVMCVCDVCIIRLCCTKEGKNEKLKSMVTGCVKHALNSL